jgi:hypothetical protein
MYERYMSTHILAIPRTPKHPEVPSLCLTCIASALNVLSAYHFIEICFGPAVYCVPLQSHACLCVMMRELPLSRSSPPELFHFGQRLLSWVSSSLPLSSMPRRDQIEEDRHIEEAIAAGLEAALGHLGRRPQNSIPSTNNSTLTSVTQSVPTPLSNAIIPLTSVFSGPTPAASSSIPSSSAVRLPHQPPPLPRTMSSQWPAGFNSLENPNTSNANR